MNTVIVTDDGAETAVRETPAEVGLTIDVAIRMENATILLDSRPKWPGWLCGGPDRALGKEGLMKRLLCSALALACLAAPAYSQAAQLGGPPSTAGQFGPAFTKHEIVQRNPQVVLIFWGYSSSEDPLVAAETDLFSRLPHSAYGGILAQYGVHDNEQLIGTFRDPGYPGWRLHRGDFEREALHARRSLGLADSPDIQWIIFAPPGADATNFPGECGEHGQFQSAGNSFVFSIVWAYQQDGCGGNLFDETATAAHEWAEAATNPFQNHNKGWWLKVDKHGLQEIADICDWQLVQPWGPSGPVVQALWSNASEGPSKDHGCVERASGGVPTPAGGAR